MSPQQSNKELVLRFFEEVFNGRQLQQLSRYITADGITHTHMPGAQPGVTGFQQFLREIWQAFPDCRVTVQDIAAEANVVAVRLSVSGTHRGPYGKVRPTGRSFTVVQLHWFHVVDGKLTEHWGTCPSQSQLPGVSKPGAAPEA